MCCMLLTKEKCLIVCLTHDMQAVAAKGPLERCGERTAGEASPGQLRYSGTPVIVNAGQGDQQGDQQGTL